MEKATIIRHEEKNQFGRTLFAIDAVIKDELYLWFEEDCCFLPNSDFFHEGDKETNERHDLQCFFLTHTIIIHLPLRLEDKNRSLELKKQEVYDYMRSNAKNHGEIQLQLKALAEEILKIPCIEKVFLPDFALNEQGDYDASQMVKTLEQVDDLYRPTNYKSVLTDYVEYIFDNIFSESQIIDRVSNGSLFEWLDFFISFEKEDLIMEDISLEVFLKTIVQNDIIDYFLDLAQPNGRIVYIYEEDIDDEDLYIYLDENNRPMCYLFNKRAA